MFFYGHCRYYGVKRGEKEGRIVVLGVFGVWNVLLGVVKEGLSGSGGDFAFTTMCVRVNGSGGKGWRYLG